MKTRIRTLAAVGITSGLAFIAGTASVAPAVDNITPVHVVPRQGDTWASVAAECQTTIAEMRRVNYLGTSAALRLDAWLKCPPPGAPTTTTVAPTTTTTTTTSTTVAPTTTTTQPPSGVQFVETFDNNGGLDRFDYGVWHRDPYLVKRTSWQGDHDLNCGSPATTRTIRRSVPSESFYTCVNHMMTSVGDTSGYSIAWFSPDQVFSSVSEVDIDVNLTDLGNRQWWKIGVVSTSLYNSVYNGACCGPAPGFLVSDVDAAGLPTNLATNDRFVASWAGGLSGGYPGGLKLGNTKVNRTANPTPNDKMMRHPVSLVDNKNGTVTFTVAGVSGTVSGAFPACPCRVVIYDHNYTPEKSEVGFPQGFTWHWDNIIVR